MRDVGREGMRLLEDNSDTVAGSGWVGRRLEGLDPDCDQKGRLEGTGIRKVER